MRLTLRTLLAYMDDVLDPADHEELGKKIEASDFAAELIHRSRDTVRRLRLGAPEVLAGEDDDVLNPDPASDANSVAEYLDSTMPPEQIAEFERVCLDSGTVADMHLAEVTSCHHVLTMVLGEPAEIDPQSRRRMYDLPQRVEGGDKLRIESAHPGVAEVVAAPLATAPIAPAVSVTPQAAPAPVNPVLPDYLRVAADRKRRTRRFATFAVLFVIGGLAMYLIMGALEEPEVPNEVAQGVEEFMDADVQVGESTDRPETLREAEAPKFVPEDAAPAPAENVAAEDEQPVEESSEASTEPVEASVATTTPPQGPVVLDDDLVSAPAVIETPVVESAPEEVVGPTIDPVQEPLATDSAADSAAPTDSAAPEDSAATASDAPPLLPPQDLEPENIEQSPTADATEVDPLDLSGDRAEEAVERARNPEGDAEEEAPPEPVGPKQLGVYVGNNDVLLRFVGDTQQWLRLPPRTSITSDDALLALPKYRTHVVLKNVNAYLSGGTMISVPDQDDTDNSNLVLEIAYGRVLLNAGLKGSQIGLKIGENVRDFHLDNSASLAVDVHRIFVPGTDYEQTSAPVEIDWYLTSGSVKWPSADGTTQIIKAPMVWRSTNGTDEAPAAIAELPNWIDREPMSELERRARDRFAEDLPVGQPVGLRLQELNEEQGAGREIRTLSAAASLYVGEFEPFIKSLNDSDQRVAWRSHIGAMRQSLAMSPQVAEKLRQEFINVRGKEAGEDLMAMIRGFTPEQIGTTREELKQGVVLDLLRWLEHESLDYRVLAIYNLDEIKGTTNLKDYRPDGIPRTRAIAVTKIRQMIEDNEFLDLP